MQVNFRLDGSRIDGFYSSIYKADGNVFYPIMWAEEGDTISEADALDFRSGVYDNRSMAKSWTVVLIILGMCIMVGALAVICKGWKAYRMKDLETIPLRSNEKKTFI